MLDNFVDIFVTWGIFDIIAPFFLIFLLIFALLMRLNMFGRKENAVIGIIFGFIVVGLHVLKLYPPCWDVVVIMQRNLPYVGLLIIMLLAFYIILAMIGVDLNLSQLWMGIIAMIIFIYVGYTFFYTGVSSFAGERCRGLNIDLAIPYLEYLIPLLIFGLIVWFITRTPQQKKKGYPQLY